MQEPSLAEALASLSGEAVGLPSGPIPTVRTRVGSREYTFCRRDHLWRWVYVAQPKMATFIDGPEGRGLVVPVDSAVILDRILNQ